MKTEKQCILFGDLHARIPILEMFNDLSCNLRYSNNPDQGSNRSGREMVSLCKTCNLLPVNHVQAAKCKFNNGLSFKMKDKWVSQLDWIFASKFMFEYIEACYSVVYGNFPLIMPLCAVTEIYLNTRYQQERPLGQRKTPPACISPFCDI